MKLGMPPACLFAVTKMYFSPLGSSPEVSLPGRLFSVCRAALRLSRETAVGSVSRMKPELFHLAQKNDGNKQPLLLAAP